MGGPDGKRQHRDSIILVSIWSIFACTDQFVVGIIVGSIFALGAIGLTLIYGLLKIAHIVDGDMMMFTAYLSFFFLTGAVVGTWSPVVAVLPLHFGRLPGGRKRSGDSRWVTARSLRSSPRPSSRPRWSSSSTASSTGHFAGAWPGSRPWPSVRSAVPAPFGDCH